MSEPASIPGETGQELSGPSATEAMLRRFQLSFGAPRERFSPQSIRVEKAGRWVLITVALPVFGDVTVRINRTWAITLRDGLSEALK